MRLILFGELSPDWGNTAGAAMARLGSIGLMIYLEPKMANIDFNTSKYEYSLIMQLKFACS